MKTRRFILVPLCLLYFATVTIAQQADSKDTMRDCPMHDAHATADSHHAVVQKHGDEAMGFSRETTTHHFVLSENGGSIEVTANDGKDKLSTDAIHNHLSHIAIMFAEGDFSTPMFIHDGIPPGTTTMKLLKSKIHYRYEDMSAGARVRIESSDLVAIAAIHDFLRFQIADHQTGDPSTAGDQH